METHPETEVKLEVTPDIVMPDLAGLPAVRTVEHLDGVFLEAVYFDTGDLRLARALTTLRRRTGGPDDGWHLKLPVSAHERLEVLVPLGPVEQGVPVELLSAVRARVRTEPLGPVVMLSTQRTVHLLRNKSGRVLAEVADDAVTSCSPEVPADVVDAWREWEVELGEGDRDLLVATVEQLRSAGGAVSGWPSKLARALGVRLTGTEASPLQESGTSSAGAVLESHLRAQRDDLLAFDPRVRRDEPDAVHKMRVATRQLRSALATFGPLLAGQEGEVVRDELRWLGEILGAARDAEVASARLLELVEAEPDELVVGPVRRRLEADRAGAYRAAFAEVMLALDSERYFRLLDTLDALVDRPALTPSAARPAEEVLPARVRREWDRLARDFRTARREAGGPRSDEYLHETRKAAKRVRYAAEAISPALGRPARKLAQAAKDLQTLLGDHHDCVGSCGGCAPRPRRLVKAGSATGGYMRSSRNALTTSRLSCPMLGGSSRPGNGDAGCTDPWGTELELERVPAGFPDALWQRRLLARQGGHQPPAHWWIRPGVCRELMAHRGCLSGLHPQRR